MSPFDAAWRLLKEDPLDPEERTPIKDEMVNYKFPSAGPYWTLNDRQKRIADAVMDLPSEYLSEEGWSGYDFDHLFAEGHETVPDQEYDRLEDALRYFKSYIKDHMAHPDSDKSPEFLESWDDPRHPWARARHMAFYRETEPYDHFSEDFKEANKSEPMDLAWRLLKNIDELQLCPSCQGVGFSGDNDFSDEPKCRSCFGTGLAGAERYHPGDSESPHTRDWGYVKDEKIGNTMEKPYVNPHEDDEREYFSLHRDVRRYLDSRPQPIRMRTLQGEPTFAYTPFAGAGKKMKNPAAEIFRRGEPIDLAMRLLKEENMLTEEQRAELARRMKRVNEAKRQYLDDEIEMERAGGLEGWRRDVLREIEENPYQFRRRTSSGGGGQTRLPGFREHFITSARQRGNEGVGHPVALRPAIRVTNDKENRFEGDERQRLELLPKRPKPRVQPARLRMNIDSENATRDFFLEDEAGNVLSRIDDIGRYKLPGKDVSLIDREPIHGLDAGRLAHYGGYSDVPRQGYYRDLLESILRHGFRITSDDRNDQSNPFHRKFLRTIPDDIRAFTEDGSNEPGRWDRIDYKGKAPFSRTKDLDYGDLAVETRSKYPITYDTPWMAHQKVLDRGVRADRDIVVPTHVDREGNVVEPKRYVQSRLAGMPPLKNHRGEVEEPFAGQETITTKEGIVVPKKFKSQYFTPHVQTGGTLGVGRGDGKWGTKLVTQPQPSAQALMNFGIDPLTRARQQVGVVDSGAPRPDASESEKQLNARANLAAQLMGQS